MTARERTTYFERLCGMRDAYLHMDALDRAGITPICEAMADAERELAAIELEADNLSVDEAANASHPA